MSEELKDGDLAYVKGVEGGHIASTREETLAQFRDDRCPFEEDSDLNCDPECCRYWRFFGSDITAAPSQVEVQRNVRVVDCE